MPATSSMRWAHQPGQTPSGVAPPAPSTPPNRPRTPTSPWQTNRNDTTTRVAPSTPDWNLGVTAAAAMVAVVAFVREVVAMVGLPFSGGPDAAGGRGGRR